jgi:hypothetical protein
MIVIDELGQGHRVIHETRKTACGLKIRPSWPILRSGDSSCLFCARPPRGLEERWAHASLLLSEGRR